MTLGRGDQSAEGTETERTTALVDAGLPVAHHGGQAVNGREGRRKDSDAGGSGANDAAGLGGLELRVVQAPPVPSHRVQLVRALADAVVASLAVGDAEGARLALQALTQVVGAV